MKLNAPGRTNCFFLGGIDAVPIAKMAKLHLQGMADSHCSFLMLPSVPVSTLPVLAFVHASVFPFVVEATLDG